MSLHGFIQKRLPRSSAAASPTGDDGRYGQAGVKASLPMWRANPDIKSELFNLNGLAQKVVFDVDAFVADSNQDMTIFPRYDSLDDDSTEHFRRRIPVNTFGQANGTFVPTRFDDRFFALRSNLQGSVASPATEIVDDMMQVRMGIKQRWQTKRGLAGQERLVDWITAETNAVFFPSPTRDNFGNAIGLVDYNFAWHVGDRFTILGWALIGLTAMLIDVAFFQERSRRNSRLHHRPGCSRN